MKSTDRFVARVTDNGDCGWGVVANCGAYQSLQRVRAGPPVFEDNLDNQSLASADLPDGCEVFRLHKEFAHFQSIAYRRCYGSSPVLAKPTIKYRSQDIA